jgi:hypothetical protein
MGGVLGAALWELLDRYADRLAHVSPDGNTGVTIIEPLKAELLASPRTVAGRNRGPKSR